MHLLNQEADGIQPEKTVQPSAVFCYMLDLVDNSMNEDVYKCLLILTINSK